MDGIDSILAQGQKKAVTACVLRSVASHHIVPLFTGCGSERCCVLKAATVDIIEASRRGMTQDVKLTCTYFPERVHDRDQVRTAIAAML